jgi:DNA repair photolyase
MKNVYESSIKVGIGNTPKFAEKGLAIYGVNIGTKCNNDCYYCYLAALPVAWHKSFKQHGVVPAEFGYAIVDPDKPEKVAKDARRIKGKGTVMLCTYTDAWCPAAREYGMGRKLLTAILENNSELTVRILTKNREVEDDFDLIEKYRDRVLVGLSLTAPIAKSKIMEVVERNASPNRERMKVLQKAHRMGLRVYGMLCPLLPTIADDPKDIDELVRFCEEIDCEEIFSEALNSRARGLELTQNALSKNHYFTEAMAIEAIHQKANWSEYALGLVQKVQSSVRKHSDISKLRFLQYPSDLLPEHIKEIKNNDEGVAVLCNFIKEF